MYVPPVIQLIPALQTAIGPAILISGLGLLLLTMTNRLGRAIDRARALTNDLPVAAENKRAKLSAQIEVLWRRAYIIRLAITLASVSALVAAILILVLFFASIWQLEVAWLIIALFSLCILCLIGSLIVFVHDINQSLTALKLELATDE